MSDKNIQFNSSALGEQESDQITKLIVEHIKDDASNS